MTAPRPGRSSIGVRVRPNANDFIKDLEKQLASKKYTFYADVHANLKPANKEIQNWKNTTLRNLGAKIGVGANTSAATVEMGAWRTKQRSIKTKVPVGVDLTAAYAQLMAFRKVASKPIDVEIKVSSDGAARAARRFQDALARQAINVPITVDRDSMTRAASKIDTDLVRRLQNQGGVLLDVNANTAPAQANLAQFAARARGTKVETSLDLDLKRAQLRLKQLQADLLQRKLEVDVDVRKSGLSKVKKAFDQIEGGLGNVNFVRSLDFGPFNLGKPGGLLGTLTTITALAGALPAAALAATSFSKALMDISGAAALVPGAIGGIMASIGTFTVGVSGMSDAFDAMIEMWTETPAQAASSARRSVQAHNQLRQAVRDEAQAQRDVGAARREATNDLRNLNNELRGSVLNEAQAILDLQKARDRLAQGGFDNMTDMRQAQLDEAKAYQNLINVRERNSQLQQKANEETAKGVEGSDKVQEALERQTRATEQAAMAMEAISSTQATSALGKFQQELDQLTPNAREFMMVLVGMKGGFMDLRNMVQETMFANTAPAFQQFLNNLMPVVGPGMQSLAQAMNENILKVFDSLGGEQGQSIIERILGGTTEAQRALTNLIDPVVRGVGTLMAAGAEHLPQVVDLFTRLAERFADFIESADKSGKLDEFMDRGIGALEKMAELGINLVQIVSNLGDAFGGDLLQSLVDVTQKFEDWIKSAEGQQQINKWIEQAQALWEQWKPVLANLPAIFEQIGEAARNVIGPVLEILDGITSFLKENPNLVQGFITAWLGAKILVGAASPIVQLAKLLTSVVSAVKGLPGLLSKIKGLPMGLPGMPGAGPGGAPVAPPIVGSAPGWLGTAATAALPLAPIAAGVIAAPIIAAQNDNKLAAWNAERDAAPDEGARNAIDRKWRQELFGVSEIPAGMKPGDMMYEWFAADIKAGKYKESMPTIGVNDEGRIIDTSTGKVIPGFNRGGYTDWPRKVGQVAMLHGGEYVEPYDTVKHYGVDAMKAIHEKRVPKAALQSFEEGGLFKNLFQHGMEGVSGVVNNVTPMINHGISGALPPGPGADVAAGVPGVSPPVSVDSPSINILGMNVPLGGQADPTRGWGPGGPPIGLGGGDGFDIRKFGIGPGPVGSGPADWMQFAGKTLGNFLSGTVGALGQGILGAFGLEGILNSPYYAGATGLLSHFLNPNQTGVGGVQAAGADATNAAVADSLNTFYGMPLNPEQGAIQLPATIADPTAPGNAGLQVNTLRGKALIQQAFPWATNIGGVRKDALKWHPNGLALDVMIPGAGGNNDPTPPEGKVMGDQMYSWLMANKEALGIDYVMWQEKDHLNHLHVNFRESGMPEGGVQVPGLIIPGGAAMAAQPGASTGIPALDELNAALAAPASSGGNNGPLDLGVGSSAMNGTNFSGAPITLGPRRGGPQWISPNVAFDSGEGGALTNKKALKEMAHQLYLAAGMPAAEWPAFDRLIQKESSWNPTAKNPSSTAYGLGQFLDITDAQYGPRSPDPMVQLPRIFQYIKDRYNGSPAQALAFHNKNNWYDRGGWLMPGQSSVDNATGKPELVVPWDDIPGFMAGGMVPTGIVPPRPNIPLPRGPEARQINPPAPPAPPRAQTPKTAPSPAAQPPVPPPPGVAHGGTGAAPGPAAPVQEPIGAAQPPPLGMPGVIPAQIGTGVGPGEDGNHLHPAISKGIRSGAATLGNLASTAISIAASMGAGGGTAGAASGIGGAAGGGLGSFVAGLIQQGGKIIEDVANVGASFLVGNITNGTTENRYGVTQRSSTPSGATSIVDRSSRFGDVYTQSPREFFRQLDLRDAQQAQASMAGYDRYA